jgi:hypothetical protein
MADELVMIEPTRKRPVLGILALILGGVGLLFALIGCVTYLLMWGSMDQLMKMVVVAGHEGPGTGKLIIPKVFNWLGLLLVIAGIVLAILSFCLGRERYGVLGLSCAATGLLGLFIFWIWSASRNPDDYMHTQGEKANVNLARARAKALTRAAEAYRIDHKVWPDTLQQLVQSDEHGMSYLKDTDALFDPWEQPFQYVKIGPHHGGTSPDVWTTNPSTGEQIGNW